MRNKINFLFLLVVSAFMFACEEEMEEFTGPYTLFIAGPHGVVPEEVATFTLGDMVNPESYTWAVEGPAQIVGDATGSTIEVEFLSVGNVVISATNGADAGTIEVAVGNVAPEVTTVLNEPGVLASGDADTLFFSFASPLAKEPVLKMNTGDSFFNEGEDAFTSGVLGNIVKVDDLNYYVIYTAGEGDGIPEASFGDLITTETFGSDTVKNVRLQLYEVDNTDPLANLSYSQEVVNDNTNLVVNVTFSEGVTFENPEDEALYLTFSGAGVEEERVALVPTNDPLVYTYKYIVSGGGNGTLEVGVENVADIVGNPLAAVNRGSVVRVDNVDPEILAASATAKDQSNVATILISSSEAGTGRYLILDDAATAPATAEEFMAAEGIAAGSVNLEAGVPAKVNELLSAGDYAVYFLVLDRAGNVSEIENTPLSVD